jgi:hypothetical protein
MKLHRLAVLGTTAAAGVSLLALPAAAATTKPTAVFAACTKAQVKPTKYVFTCGDYGLSMKNVTYSHKHGLAWGDANVSGRGTYVYNDCTPDCASGTFHHHPVTFYLHGRKTVGNRKLYTKIDVSYAGLTETFTLPTKKI